MPKALTIRPPLLTTREFAEKVGVNEYTIRRYAKLGYIKPYSKTPSGYAVYHEDQVKTFQEEISRRMIAQQNDQSSS